MSITWYNDRESKIAYDLIKKHLETMVATMFPGHELSHVGINRNFESEEVIIKLHLNQIGKIKVQGYNNDIDILRIK